MTEADLAAAIAAAAGALRPGCPALAAPELDHLGAGIAAAVPGTPAMPRANQGVRAHLASLLAGSVPAPLTAVAAALAAVHDRLDWHYHYAERDDAPGLGAQIAFSELIGPDAPLRAPDIRAGFTFMAPGVLYPAHAHPAIELYVVLSGRALWTRGDVASWQDPGAVIVHASEEPHAMQSFDAPVLALYSWRGAIGAPARYV